MKKISGYSPYLAMGYVATVLLADTFALKDAQFIFDWGALRGTLYGGEVFKFAAWLVLPLFICTVGFEGGFFGVGRWMRIDWALLAVIVCVGGMIMLALPWIPEVGDYYRGWGAAPLDVRFEQAARHLFWTASWLSGWEFMHRYWIPKALLDRWPNENPWRGGALGVLVVVPMLEAGYHVIQGKPALECLGMGLLSLVFCWWVVRRRNALLPFLAHLAIEIELVIFLFFAT